MFYLNVPHIKGLNHSTIIPRTSRVASFQLNQLFQSQKAFINELYMRNYIVINLDFTSRFVKCHWYSYYEKWLALKTSVKRSDLR